MNEKLNEKLKEILLWIIYEQCTYGGNVYAKLLTHGEEAFNLLGLPYVCNVSVIEELLFSKKRNSK